MRDNFLDIGTTLLPNGALLIYTIIITTYNRKLKVNRAIESAVSETKGKNIEIIVVDDASTDGTEASIQGYITSKNIQYIKQKHIQDMKTNYTYFIYIV